MMTIERFEATRVNRRLWKSLLGLGVAGALVVPAITAQATTYTNVVTGPPASGKCNLSDAIKAASTNTAVHSCAAGSSTTTDTIALTPGASYSGWGVPLHVPPTGGALAITGGVNSGGAVTTLIMNNNSYPNPQGGTSACGFPAGIFVGGTLTITQVQLTAADPFFTGVCQYAGSLTLAGMGISDFSGGAILSATNTNTPARTLVLKNGTLNNRTFVTAIEGNSTPGSGGGLLLNANVNTTITDAFIESNSADASGAAIAWIGGWGKMGNLTITHATVDNNNASIESGNGGAYYFDPDDVNATVTINTGNIQNNAVARPEFSAIGTGGAIYVGSGFGTNKLVINNTFLSGNVVYGYPSDPFQQDGQAFTLNPDSWVYNAVYCKGGSHVPRLVGSFWNVHSPPLKGDGTCTFPIAQ